MGSPPGLHRHGHHALRRCRHGHCSTCLEGVDFKKVDEILGLREKGLTAVVLLSLGYRNPNDGNAMRPKSRLATEEIFTEIK